MCCRSLRRPAPPAGGVAFACVVLLSLAKTRCTRHRRVFGAVAVRNLRSRYGEMRAVRECVDLAFVCVPNRLKEYQFNSGDRYRVNFTLKNHVGVSVLDDVVQNEFRKISWHPVRVRHRMTDVVQQPATIHHVSRFVGLSPRFVPHYFVIGRCCSRRVSSSATVEHCKRAALFVGGRSRPCGNIVEWLTAIARERERWRFPQPHQRPVGFSSRRAARHLAAGTCTVRQEAFDPPRIFAIWKLFRIWYKY